MATILLLIIYLAFISLGLPDSLLGAAWPVMRGDLGAPIELAGVLSITITAGTVVSSLATGHITKRYGTGTVTLISSAMTAGALIGFSFSPSVAWLVVFAIPLGLGGGAVDSALNHYVAGHYQAHHMSWLHCFWGVGATVGPMIMAAYLADAHWRDGYLAVGTIQLVLVAILLASLPLWGYMAKKRSGGLEPRSGDAPRQNADTRRPDNAAGVKYALATFLFYCGVEATFGLWGSSYLVRAKGLGADEAALWVSLYFAGITVGRLIAGFITFKLSNPLLIRAGQIIALTGALLLLLPLPDPVILGAFILTGLGLAPIFPSMLHETPRRFGEAHAGRIIGYQIATAYTGVTVLPPLLGLLAGLTTIGIFPIYAVLLAAAMLLVTERLNILVKKGEAARSNG